jgi:hypothetical protein
MSSLVSSIDAHSVQLNQPSQKSLTRLPLGAQGDVDSKLIFGIY